MYEKLTASLRYCSETNSLSLYKRELMKAAADAIEDLDNKLNLYRQGKISHWIPVAERLPKSGVHVLLACKCRGSSYVCDGFHTEKFSLETAVWEDIEADYNEKTDEYYFPEGWWEVIKNWDDYSCVAIEDEVTHWMPLPETPESEGTK